ncbi:MAG TPA: MMPL family transporter [Solirubrobacteraceae bacterium]
MSETTPSKIPLAARMGRWSATHRRTAIFGWIGFVAVALFIGGALGTKTIERGHDGTGSSGRADRVLADEFPQPASEQVLVQARHGTLRTTDPRARAAVSDVVARLSALPQVKRVKSPFAPGHSGQISRDGLSLVVQFDIRGKSETASDRVQPALDAVARAQRAHPSLRIEQFGEASVSKAFDDKLGEDFRRTEFLSLPITLAILILTFGALMAAGLPLLLALTSVAATIGLVGVASQLSPVDESISSVIVLIGMAVGVDYSLFYMRREREERAAGASNGQALATASATSGRAVLISGMTVMAAMAGMYFTGSKTFASFATGTIIVVAVAMLGSVTVLPALMSKLGDRVERGRIPGLHRERATESRFWGWIVDRVMRRPLLTGALATAVLVAMALPAFGMRTGLPGTQGLPRDLAIMKTYDRVQAAFPGGPEPAVVAIQADDVTAPAVGSAIRDLAARAERDPQIGRPVTASVSSSHRTAVLSIPLAGAGTDARSNAALARLRDELIPQTVGRVSGVRADVTGMTAGSKDFNDLLKSNAPIVFGFVLSLAFLLLLVTFRSLVIPVKAIVLNLLSVGAAYGVLVWIFQDGHGEKLLGFRSNGAITSWLPLFLFVILFGLSMDYHVFILSRIREAVDRGMKTGDAVARGIKSTAGVVTSAAVVMVGVFSIFATLSLLEFKQMGIGLAVAVLIDATIIRGVLLPATMRLLGDWNWYLPRWLEWLPRLEHEPAEKAPEAPAIPVV